MICELESWQCLSNKVEGWGMGNLSVKVSSYCRGLGDPVSQQGSGFVFIRLQPHSDMPRPLSYFRWGQCGL